MAKMNLSGAIKKAAMAAKKYGGDDKGKKKKEKMKEQDIPEVRASGNVFTGPFSRMKAKKAIKKGETDVAYAKKKGFGGKEKTIKYADKGSAVDLSRLTALNMEKPKGTNKPVFMKKSVLSSTERRSERIRRATEE